MRKLVTAVFLSAALALSAQTEKSATPLAPQNSKLKTQNSTRAVVVGISDYQDPEIPDLRFAHRDAEAFANFLRSPAGGALDGDHLKVLTNGQATIARFGAALDWLMDESKEGDQAVIYFSGHGDVETKTRSQQGFLLCWDSPPQAYVSGAYPIFFLKEVISTLSLENKARVIVITDACRAGKLAGNAVGGAQLTSQNLAQQFANEIKMLSCQPNEYSLEGEQWGGGRGAFSYHLVNALYGLADQDEDDRVTVKEMHRYLEDRVPVEAAPERQNPLVVGDRESRLAKVAPNILAALRKNLSGQMPIFSPVDNRGLEDEILAGVDTNIRALYGLFKKALKDKVFLEPVDACADAYYLRLIAEPKLERLHNIMRRNYAAALQDDAQQAVNSLMKMENTEVRLYRLERLKKYAPYPRLLERAAELLGPEHYMYPTLQARKCYFEGRVLQLESPLYKDSLLAIRLMDTYRTALKWQPNSAVTYYAMSTVFEKIMPQPDSLLYYAQLTIKQAPAWTAAYSTTAISLLFRFQKMEAAKKLLDQAFEIDSTRAEVWAALGYVQTNFEAAEQCFLKSIALDSSYYHAFLSLGGCYFELGQYAKAQEVLLKAAQTDHPDVLVFDFLGCIQLNYGQNEAAETFFKRGLEIDPTNSLCLVHFAGLYLTMSRPEKADSLLIEAMRYDSSSCFILDMVGQFYITLKYFNEAEHLLLKSVSMCPKYLNSWDNLAIIYRHTGRKKAAYDTYHHMLNIFSDSPFGYLGLALLAVEEGKTAEPLGLIEQAIRKGCAYEQVNIPEFNGLAGFGELVKKHFPDQAKN